MTTCNNSACKHPIESHTPNEFNHNILTCHHRWILIGPKGEYWKWMQCDKTCEALAFDGVDGPRQLTSSDKEPIPIFRTPAEQFKVYKIKMTVIVNSGSGSYDVAFRRYGGEVKHLTLTSGTSEYVDVLEGNTLVTVQGTVSGDMVVNTVVEKC